MNGIEFSLAFFAQMVRVKKSRVHYALLVTKGSTGEEKRPVIYVDGVSSKVYDITTAQFIPCISDEKSGLERTTEMAKVRRSARGFAFMSIRSRRKYFLKNADFIKAYQDLVVSELLEN